jgi:hypothetical protein
MAGCVIRLLGHVLFSALLASPALADPEIVFFPSADGTTAGRHRGSPEKLTFNPA